MDKNTIQSIMKKEKVKHNYQVMDSNAFFIKLNRENF